MSAAPQSITRRKPIGRPVTPETPLQRIEGEAYGAIAELVYYRDGNRVIRLHADSLCDDGVRRMEQAFRNGDAPAFWAAADDYWLADADEDQAAEVGDRRVSNAHTHVRVIPAQCVEMEARR